ncbi:MAG: UvrD-helicase domain-containing protein [Treponema sp.]|nr:UvrD-helicase domain-containing protein [Candidatus Treponema equi]
MANNTETKKRPEFDSYQKDAINARKNSVVSAGAGSGKTTVLAERFSSLVLEPGKNIGVDQILTLTFTKKATVEMSARIYKVLRQHDPQKAADFFKANIKTLDSYCNTVAKMGCHYYGISPDFTQDDEQINSAINAMALPYILEHRENKAIKSLVRADSFERIAEELFVEPILSYSTIAEPVDFDSMVALQVKEIVRRWNKTTELLNNDFVEMEAGFRNAQGMNFSNDTVLAYNAVYGSDATVEIPEPIHITEETVTSLKINHILEYMKITGGIAGLKKPGNLKGLKDLSEIINDIKARYEELCNLFTFISGYETTTELLPLLKDFQNKVNAYKRSTGILSFKDISNMAKCILRDYPEIRQIEKERYRFIMIDEFQDNNQDQRDMLFMLAEKLSRKEPGIPEVKDLEPEKLFFVGDEKQSIYRFRGADVSVFNALSGDFKDGNLNMSTNYRSASALIKGFNTIFGGYDYPLPAAPIENQEESNVAVEIPSAFYNNHKDYGFDIPGYEAVYKEVLLPEEKQKEAAVESNREKIFEPHIHFALFDKEKENGSEPIAEEEAEAQWIAEKIKELTTTGIGGKVYSHNDIAILMRSYSLQPLYERTFLKNGVPYNTEVVTGFFSDGPVNDIFSMLRLCAYPDDTMAYAQVLHSPWVNLTFKQANEIILAPRTEGVPFSEDAKSILPKDALRRYNHAKKFFEELNSSAKTEPLTKTVTKLWYGSGYRYETMWNNTVVMYSKLYDLIFELARQSEENKMTLGAFVDSVRTYRDQAEKLDNMDIPLEQSEGVHILSIHKSKGLEYPVVFVIATHKKGNNDRNDKAVYVSKKYGITVNACATPEIGGTNPFFSEAKEENNAMTGAELRRLAYVALTRAKDHLFITNGKYAKSKNYASYIPGNGGNPSTLFGILEPIYNYYFDGRDDATISGPFSRTFIDSEELSEGQKSSNTESAKIQLLNKIQDSGILDGIKTIEDEKLERRYANPSQLHAPDDETCKNGTFISPSVAEKNVHKEYDEINKIIDSTIPKYEDNEKQPEFSHAHFGTIAHAYLEAKINRMTPKISNRDIVGLEGKEKNLETIKKICTLMADSFEETDLGKMAMSSKWHKAEYEFRCRIKFDDGSSKIIKGTIDLVFENDDGTYTIVDYKTNQECKPEIYYNQLACYMEAVSQMMGVSKDKVKCKLYYLRFNREIDITEKVKKVDLVQAVQSVYES